MLRRIWCRPLNSPLLPLETPRFRNTGNPEEREEHFGGFLGSEIQGSVKQTMFYRISFMFKYGLSIPGLTGFNAFVSPDFIHS